MPAGDAGNLWRVATGVTAVVLACTASMWAMISVHAAHPHDAAVSRTEYEFVNNSVEQRLGRIERKLDELLER